MRLGRIARSQPLSTQFGFDRGTPIDRFYIEAFLSQHRADIRGDVLEIGDATYSKRFGGERVKRQDVLNLHPGHPDTTISGDLCDPSVLPSARFDCIICTQTLHMLFDLRGAVAQIHRALRLGGVALVTVPGITSIDRGEWKHSWYWSLTAPALERLLEGSFAPDRLRISTYGNLAAATAFLHGAAVEEVSRAGLDHFDEAYPLIVAARATA